MERDGYSLLLPAGILDYFEVKKVAEESKAITICQEEKNNIHTDSESIKYETKGFYPAVQVNDFPVRGKRLLLEIRHRRWIRSLSTETLHIVAAGARMIQKFAAFSKGLRR